MNRRKTIALITANPTGIYSRRVVDGVMAQCKKYGYNVAVFTPMVQVCSSFEDYLKGELNIFGLINFDLLDGVIVDTISLTENSVTYVTDMLNELLQDKCRVPVVALDYPLGDHELIETDDITAFEDITEHIIAFHGCRKIFFLSGQQGHEVSQKRLCGFMNAVKKHGLTVPDENVIYGDFWYSSGAALADRIASGEADMPQAVICASDHMAIGLANRLIKHGISVPDKIIVTGYDATAEAALNKPTITTFIPPVAAAAAQAVNRIHEQSEPDAPTLSAEISSQLSGIVTCRSCGCTENKAYLNELFDRSLIHSYPNYDDENIMEKIDLNRLLTSYMPEVISSSKDLDDCLSKTINYTYLLFPYEHFYLCLREDITNTEIRHENGYTEKMCLALHSVGSEAPRSMDSHAYCSLGSEHYFRTSDMLPQLWEQSEKPSVYYFMPLHYLNDTFGYAVLQRSISGTQRLGEVHSLWIRNVASSIQMTRVLNRLIGYSEKDTMTGMSNRRGMKSWLHEKTQNAAPDDTAMVLIIDMDGLKAINDTFGHAEGDYGIRTVSNVVQSITGNDEICVRTGGDEFCLIGIGKYADDEPQRRTERLLKTLEAVGRSSDKPYEITASIGWASAPYSENVVSELLKTADERMYENKLMRKKNRI